MYRLYKHLPGPLSLSSISFLSFPLFFFFFFFFCSQETQGKVFLSPNTYDKFKEHLYACKTRETKQLTLKGNTMT